jgi:hypothetical protein
MAERDSSPVAGLQNNGSVRLLAQVPHTRAREMAHFARQIIRGLFDVKALERVALLRKQSG